VGTVSTGADTSRSLLQAPSIGASTSSKGLVAAEPQKACFDFFTSKFFGSISKNFFGRHGRTSGAIRLISVVSRMGALALSNGTGFEGTYHKKPTPGPVSKEKKN
jgi:hypothetical protein